MNAELQTLCPTGNEPIDSALGGLEPGRVHVVYGELHTGKTTIALEFLIEGLRRRERCALVIRYNPEEAVASLGRLGYDCIDDLRSGRLVMLEYASDLVEQLTTVDDFSEVLAEFGWMLGDLPPQRLVFDSADYIFSIQQGYGHALQISALMGWLTESGATSLLVVEERVSERIVQAFRANARTVIHTLRRTVDGKNEYYYAFEKGQVKAPQRRVELTVEGLMTAEIIDTRGKTLPLPVSPLAGAPNDTRTGQLTTPDEAARMIAEAVASSQKAAAPPPPPLPPPVQSAAAIAGPGPRVARRTGRPRVLVIDDDPVVGQLVQRALRPDFDVEVTPDGIAGLAKIIGFDPDLVLLDINLPLVDGFTICGQIRQNSSVPILIVTGTHVRDADRIRSAELGADNYLIKPFSLKELALRARLLVARFRGETLPEPGRIQVPVAAAADPLVPYDRFVEQLERAADSVRAGTPQSLCGCTIVTNGSEQTSRLLDLLRGQLRSDDEMTYEPRRHLVLARVARPEDEVTELGKKVAAAAREDLGLELAFWTVALTGAPGASGRILEQQLAQQAKPRPNSQRDFLEFLQ
jgi:DNA-binding response OmpR family regulator/KaiC/GvpD/RAD55 family RecA-like ATPase